MYTPWTTSAESAIPTLFCSNTVSTPSTLSSVVLDVKSARSPFITLFFLIFKKVIYNCVNDLAVVKKIV